MFPSDLEQILELGLAMVISLSFHELAHARTAMAFGDPTAKNMGRMTLNPLAHLDPLGSLLFLMAGGLGWAKPVPVNPANLDPPRLGDFLVSLAGPLANLALAILGALMLRLIFHLPDWAQDHAYLHPLSLFVSNHSNIAHFLEMLVWWNLCLMLFNLIPLFPLDGHHLQRDMLPAHLQAPYMRWQMAYGRYVLVGLMTLSWFGNRIDPNMPNPIRWVLSLLGNPINEFLIYR